MISVIDSTISEGLKNAQRKLNEAINMYECLENKESVYADNIVIYIGVMTAIRDVWIKAKNNKEALK